MTSEKKNKKEMKEKVMVPRRKLQSVPELLANGVNDEDPSEPESWKTKLAWMAFLLLLYYASFELFLKLNKMSKDKNDGQSEL